MAGVVHARSWMVSHLMPPGETAENGHSVDYSLPIGNVNLSTRRSFRTLIVAFGAARAKGGYGGTCLHFWLLS